MELETLSELEFISSDENLKITFESGKTYERSCPHCSNSFSFLGENFPKACPCCGTLYWHKPKDERTLFILQDEYVESGKSQEVLAKMHLAIVSYCKTLIKKQLKGGRFISKEELEEHAYEISLRFITRYLSRDYIFKFSFGAIFKRAIWVLLNTPDKFYSKTFSLDDLAYAGANESDTKIGDALWNRKDVDREKLVSHDDDQFHIIDLKKKHEELIRGVHQAIRDSQGTRESILFLQLNLNKMKREGKNMVLNSFSEAFHGSCFENSQKFDLLSRELIKECV